MATEDNVIATQLADVLSPYAAHGSSREELAYASELVLAAMEELGPERDRKAVVAVAAETLGGAELFGDAQLSTIANKLADALVPDDTDNGEEMNAKARVRRRRMRQERFETHFAIGKGCLVVLEEDEEWHPARITRHIGRHKSGSHDGSDSESDEDNTSPIEVEVEFVEFGKKQIAREDELVLDEDVAGREEREDSAGLCTMCERPMNLTAHHVTPRETHAKYLRQGYTREFLNTCILICRQCHSKIHSVEDNRTLARKYNTLEKIVAHPEIARWIAYARKQKARVKLRKRGKWRLQ